MEPNIRFDDSLRTLESSFSISLELLAFIFNFHLDNMLYLDLVVNSQISKFSVPGYNCSMRFSKLPYRRMLV